MINLPNLISVIKSLPAFRCNWQWFLRKIFNTWFAHFSLFRKHFRRSFEIVGSTKLFIVLFSSVFLLVFLFGSGSLGTIGDVTRWLVMWYTVRRKVEHRCFYITEINKCRSSHTATTDWRPFGNINSMDDACRLRLRLLLLPFVALCAFVCVCMCVCSSLLVAALACIFVCVSLWAFVFAAIAAATIPSIEKLNANLFQIIFSH